ncbi:D-cysteine desulfhydrase family protein [Chloroflexota bacterium]
MYPLDEAPRLSVALEGSQIFIKRDDLTGLALGGNKVRKLEFVMADAIQEGADVVITTGSSQSNHACQTAAAARKLGMKTILVLEKGVHNETLGNLLLDNLFGAEVHIVEEGSPVTEVMKKLAMEARSRGHHPYLIPEGASNALGATGYVNAVKEICKQSVQKRINPRYLIAAAGSCGTMAGLIVGAKYFQAPFKVVGISVKLDRTTLAIIIANLANEIAQLLTMNLAFAPNEITIYDEYVGEGYGIPTPQCIEAIRLVAQTEGIILDPVYSAKTMAGFMDLIRQGRFTPQDTVIFVHTGGAPSVFAYANELLA